MKTMGHAARWLAGVLTLAAFGVTLWGSATFLPIVQRYFPRAFEAMLPAGVHLAYDGLEVTVEPRL